MYTPHLFGFTINIQEKVNGLQWRRWLQTLQLQEDEMFKAVSDFILYLLFYTLYICTVVKHPTKLLLVDTVIALLRDTTVLKLVLAKGASTDLKTRIQFLTQGNILCPGILLRLHPRFYRMWVSLLQIIFRYGLCRLDFDEYVSYQPQLLMRDFCRTSISRHLPLQGIKVGATARSRCA